MTPDDGEFTPEERAAMKDRAREARRARAGKATDPAAAFDAAIQALSGEEGRIAARLATLVAEHAPCLTTRTWYGMPAWSLDGKVLCFFQPASKFKARYSTLGFESVAHLDDGDMWPTAFALTTLGDEAETTIIDLLHRAVPQA